MIDWWWLIVAFVGGIAGTVIILISNPFGIVLLEVLEAIAYYPYLKEQDANEDKSGSVED